MRTIDMWVIKDLHLPLSLRGYFSHVEPHAGAADLAMITTHGVWNQSKINVEKPSSIEIPLFPFDLIDTVGGGGA